MPDGILQLRQQLFGGHPLAVQPHQDRFGGDPLHEKNDPFICLQSHGQHIVFEVHVEFVSSAALLLPAPGAEEEPYGN